MRFNITKLFQGALLMAPLLLTSCGGGGGGGGGGSSGAALSYTVGGTISGLTGSGLVLRNNGGDNLAVSPGSTSFTFVTLITSGSAYNVTVLTNPAGQTCSINTGTGIGTVAGANVTSVRVICSTIAFTISGTITGLTGNGLVLQNNGGDDLAKPASSTSFTFVTPVASGAGYNVSVLTYPSSPSQSCTVSNASGTATANVSNVTIVCGLPGPRYAFVANASDDTVSIYTVNANTGQLRANGYINLVAGSNPQSESVAVDPTGKFVYVANYGNNDISAYTIATNGELTQIACGGGAGCNGNNFLTGTNPASITIAPSGLFAYVVNTGSANVSAYSINATSGVLTPVSTSPFAAGSNPKSVTIDSTGTFAYVANYGSDDVSAYTIGVNGALIDVAATFAAATFPTSVTVDPTGKFAYVATSGGTTIAAYRIDKTTTLGALIPIATYSAGSNPSSVTVDPTGTFAYVANPTSNDISAFTINATTGALTQIPCVGGASVCNGNNFLAGSGTNAVVVEPSGKFAYAVNSGSNDVSVYTINASTGFLTAASTVRARSGSISIAFSKSTSLVTYTPKFAYAANYGTDTVSAYQINSATGVLASVGSPYPTGSLPSSVAVDPFGKFAYVANAAANTVSAYTINAATGELAYVADIGAGLVPTPVTVDPSGRFAYVANYGSSNVSAYSIHPTTGVLTLVGTYPAGTAPNSIVVDSSGRFAYVANYGSDDVSAYSINPITGALTSVTGSPFAEPGGAVAPFSITVDPSGKFVVTANTLGGASNDVTVFIINATDGSLTPVTPDVGAGTDSYAVTVEPSGKFAYVANLNSNNISAYSINSTTGVLSPVAGSPYAVTSNPYSITVDPSGKFVYATLPVAVDGVAAFTINPTTGALTAVSGSPFPAQAGGAPVSVITTGSIQ